MKFLRHLVGEFLDLSARYHLVAAAIFIRFEPDFNSRLNQNLVNFSNSFTRCSICARLIFVVRFNPKPSQQNEATTLP